MVYIAYYTELNLQICNYTQKRSVCRKNSDYMLDEIFMASFALAERLQTSATLIRGDLYEMVRRTLRRLKNDKSQSFFNMVNNSLTSHSQKELEP